MEIAAAYRTLGSRWDRAPLVGPAGETPAAVERRIQEARRLLAAAAAAAWARNYRRNSDALLTWAHRSMEPDSERATPQGEAGPADDSASARLRRAYMLLVEHGVGERAAAAQALDAAVELASEQQPARRLIHALRTPVLLTRMREGSLAWLWMERVAGGLGVAYRSAATLLDPLTEECTQAVDAACRVAQQRSALPEDEDVRWWLSDMPADSGGLPLAVDGQSLQAAAAALYLLLREGAAADTACAISGTVDPSGAIGPVSGFEGSAPKLQAARLLSTAETPARVLLSHEALPSAAARASWLTRGVEVSAVSDIGEAARLATIEGREASPAYTAVRSPAMTRIEPARRDENNGGTVALIYARQSETDVALADQLTSALRKRGYNLQAEASLGAGLEWARMNERQVRQADIVLIIASPAAAISEMVMHLAQVVRSAGAATGKPQVVVVGAGSEGRSQLHLLLSEFPRVSWTEARAVEQVVDEIAAALRGSVEPLTDEERRQLVPPTGVLPLDSPHYLPRATDPLFQAALSRGDSLVRIRGARQMGKTSLLARGLQKAREAGAEVLLTDLQLLNASHFQDAESFLMGTARWIGQQMESRPVPEAVWDDMQGPNANFRSFFLNEVLEGSPGRIIWALDEVDRLFPTSFGAEVFGMLRAWHNERSLNPAMPWRKLTIVLSYATEAQLFIADLNQSPFNVGTRIALQDFSLAEVSAVNETYRAPLRQPSEVKRLHDLLGGHPYLTTYGLHELAVHSMSIGDLEEHAADEGGIFSDHLSRLVTILAQSPESTNAVKDVLKGGPCPSTALFHRLWSGGVLSGESASQCRLRCRLYEIYLSRHLR